MKDTHFCMTETTTTWKHAKSSNLSQGSSCIYCRHYDDITL